MPSIASKENKRTEIKAHALSNVQMELLKLYSTDLEHDDLMELRILLANHFAEKAMNGADTVWDQKEISVDTMETWLNEH